MLKKEFLIKLKNISDILTKHEIKHEIPFVYITKNNFDYIDIIISDDVLKQKLARIFNITKIVEDDNIYYTTIDNFNFNFIRTSENKWQYTFYYYSWNILHNLISIIYKKNFDIDYTRYGLKYKTIDISSNIIDIIEFLDLNIKFIVDGFLEEDFIYNYIKESIYYNSVDFNIDDFIKNDKMFNYNKKYYNNFLKNKNNISNDRVDDFEYLIDSYFKNDFMKNFYKLSIIQSKRLNERR